ncbi:hypothetical protein GLOIN_2v1469334 [Rhizophagus irregularis DAOM 181602=DAOM 197198]|nr:hypothetical protein GLOIN_2v1469334 [Rhizophagus irregularis DAOM 181602=DAOM 197198]
MKKFWILQEFRDENLEQKENEFISKDGLNVSDWDDADNVDESEICENWINLAEHENQFDNEEDNHLLEMAQNFYAAGRNVHPADDETAKWNLKYLFNENIQAPTLLGIDNNLA